MRLKQWAAHRVCKRTDDCLSISGHAGACRPPTDQTRRAIAELPNGKRALYIDRYHELMRHK